MGFVGSVPSKLRIALREKVGSRPIFNGCSGNFTIEKALSGGGRRIWSNDVSLYSCFLGYAITGQDRRLEIRGEGYEWLSPYLTSPASKFVTVACAFEIGKHHPRKNHFQADHWKHWRNRFDDYHAKGMEKLKAVAEGIEVERFMDADVAECLAEVPEEFVVVMSPPTYAGGYERLYRFLEETFSWDAPRYEMIDDEGYRGLIERVRDRGRYVVFTDREIEGMGHPESVYDRGAGFKRMFMYAGGIGSRTFYLKDSPPKWKDPKFLRLDDGFAPTGEEPVTLREMSNEEANFYKECFLAKKIVYVNASLNLAVFIGGAMLGVLSFSRSKWGGQEEIYMMSDFAVTKAWRASKLLVMIALSSEVRELLEEKFLVDAKKLKTTAFTKKPVSMKYRGVLKLVKRAEDFLQYEGEPGKWTAGEAVAEFVKRYKPAKDRGKVIA